MTTVFDWTNEATVVALKCYWADGLTCKETAIAMMNKFGGTLTRNAVMGKVSRIGLPRREMRSNVSEPRAPKLPRTPKPRTQSRVIKTESWRKIIEAYDGPVRDLPEAAIPAGQRKRLVDLESHHCRFPYGDPSKPNFFFCGGVSESHQPYCLYHCSIAFTVGRAPTSPESNLKRRLKALKRKSNMFDSSRKRKRGRPGLIDDTMRKHIHASSDS